MRILFAADVNRDPNSGAAGTEYQTLAGLRRLGHEVDEIWRDDLPHWVRHGNLHYLLELPRAYRRAIRRKWQQGSYDVVHVNQGHSYLAAEDHRRSRRPGVFVCRSHGLDDHMEIVLRGWRRQLGIRNRSVMKAIPGRLIDQLLFRHDRLAARYSSGYIVSSSLDREFLIGEHGMQPDRVACIPQAPAEVFVETPAPPLSPDRLRHLLHVGSFAYWKGPHTVAEVANQILPSHPDARLTWVCASRDHDRAAQLLSPDARPRTRFVGHLSQQELLDVYDRHGIFLCPSLFEGFCKVFLEAMARGLCVIGTRVGGMRDIIETGRNGLLVETGDARAVVEHIEHLWAHAEMASTISAEAAREARQYSWDRVARETAAFYESLLGMRRAEASAQP